MSANLKTVSTPTLRDRVTNEEWQMRVDLAAAYQLAAIYKWTDLIYTHFSARVPGTEDFLNGLFQAGKNSPYGRAIINSPPRAWKTW